MASIATRHHTWPIFCIADGCKSHDRHDERSGVRILVANQHPLHNPSSLLSSFLVIRGQSYPITGVSSCRTVTTGDGWR
ncbi:uncharacterized protein N7473_002459 [Penicillium subrubescens]|uniref:uncharacterized protein n=1 Tax=Penicillium subrubescens TaxID=1316194 RepID=UPI002544F894|nr:uncharacterized protein N7473_002459 [Penicillium subrubescens]KAJ5905543.1 hypothetical protein N7473_002459 [Penicillium subrubescens]